MKARQVHLVEITVYEKFYPVVSGYLQAYACTNPDIKNGYRFKKSSVPVRTRYSEILGSLMESNSDIYAFSCYVWNMGLVKLLLRPLLEAKQEAYFILGGPQVMHCATEYLDPHFENLVICNGEGERTFSRLLSELLNDKPDLGTVRGLSFYKDRQLITTPEQERITNLDEIPSPYLLGVFDKPYSMAIIETNRGCPFSCGFCFWGAATHNKVFKFSENRIREELTWLSQNDCTEIYVADANWGLFPRDVLLSRHIASCATEYGMPTLVFFTGAKNKPDRVTEITETFRNAGIATSQSVSLQSLNRATLDVINRTNIRLEDYMRLQETLNRKKMGSFTEVIWPLPRETLSSFKSGIDTLCGRKADTIICYPHVLLKNTPLNDRKMEFGLVTTNVDEGIGETAVVIQTNDVSLESFREGIRFYYAVHLLHNMRNLFATANYLAHEERLTFSELFSKFSSFSIRHREHPMLDFCVQSTDQNRLYDVTNYGEAVHLALHAYRHSLSKILYQFVSSEPWWEDSNVQFLFEVDLLNRPYVYSNTLFGGEDYAFKYLTVEELGNRRYSVTIPDDRINLLQFAELGISDKSSCSHVVIDHRRSQYPFMKSQSLEQSASYCHGMILRIQEILPKWTSID